MLNDSLNWTTNDQHQTPRQLLSPIPIKTGQRAKGYYIAVYCKRSTLFHERKFIVVELIELGYSGLNCYNN